MTTLDPYLLQIAGQVYVSPLLLSFVWARHGHHWNPLQLFGRAIGVVYPLKPYVQTRELPKPRLDPADTASLK